MYSSRHHHPFRFSRLMQAILLAVAATRATVAVAAQQSVSLGTVQAAGHKDVSTQQSQESKKLTKKHQFRSGQSVKVIDKSELRAVGPVAGGAQAISVAPGVAVTGYGATGSTKNSISVNGLKQGWGGFSAGQIDNGALSVTFDGVPMVNPSTSLWATPQIPQLQLLQGVGITYGPGNPKDRWYNNIAGQIDFVPLQPSTRAGGTLSLSAGSYSARNLFFAANTGRHDGWSTIVAGGHGQSGSYRTTPDGFDNSSHNYAYYLKTRKTFDTGNFSIGVYQAEGQGYRPVMIPVAPIAGVTETGAAGSPLYSQPTSGFYSAISPSIWYKQDTNKTRLIYSKLNVALDSSLTLHNLVWYRLGERVHFHYNNYGLSNPGNLFEYNDPRTSVYGEKMWTDIALPYNLVSVGGFFLKSQYNTRQSFYNPYAPYFGSQQVPNAHFRSDYWDQTDLAAFLQDKISPTRTLDITPGVRLITYETSYFNGGQTDFPQAYALNPANNQGTLPAANVSHAKAEPSIALNWRARRWLALFGNYGVAYKEPQVGGGGGLFQSLPPIYNLEKSQDYNVGFKVHLPHRGMLRHFLLSVAYYHLDFSNQFIALTDANGNYLGDADGNSVYDGVNIALADDPLYNLHLFTNLNVEKATFSNYTTGGVSYSGLPVSNVPKSTFNLGAAYKYYADHILYVPSAWYQYIGQQNMFNNNLGIPTQQKIPGYGTFNLALDTILPKPARDVRDIKVSFDVLNVFNKQYNFFEYITSGGFLGPSSQGQVLAVPGAPRTYYVSVSADF